MKFSVRQLMTFTLFVVLGMSGLPLAIGVWDVATAGKPLPPDAKLVLGSAGGYLGAIAYLFTIPANPRRRDR